MAKRKVRIEAKIDVTEKQMKPALTLVNALSAYLNGKEMEDGMGVVEKEDVTYYLKKVIRAHEDDMSRFGIGPL